MTRLVTCENLEELKNSIPKKIEEAIKNNDYSVHVQDNNALSGDGSKNNPLKTNFNKDDFLLINNELRINKQAPKPITDFGTHKYEQGMHVFSGEATYTIGLPINIESEESEQNRAMSVEQMQGNKTYDFNGYYIATDKQLDIWLQGINHTAWFISNEDGINADGFVKNPANWGKWQKLDNSSVINNELVTNLQAQVNAINLQLAEITNIKSRISELEKPCHLGIKEVNSAYTVENIDNTIISSGGTITFPDTIETGRVITVIQSGNNAVSLVGNIVAPFDGSLTLAGDNAVVSVIKTSSKFRAVGQTKQGAEA